MGRQGGGGCGAVVEGARPVVALQIFIKLALNDDMDARVLVAYRFMFAAAFLCPIAFVVERIIYKLKLHIANVVVVKKEGFNEFLRSRPRSRQMSK